MKPLISFAKKRFGRKHHLKKFFMGYSFMPFRHFPFMEIQRRLHFTDYRR